MDTPARAFGSQRIAGAGTGPGGAATGGELSPPARRPPVAAFPTVSARQMAVSLARLTAPDGMIECLPESRVLDVPARARLARAVASLAVLQSASALAAPALETRWTHDRGPRRPAARPPGRGELREARRPPQSETPAVRGGVHPPLPTRVRLRGHRLGRGRRLRMQARRGADRGTPPGHRRAYRALRRPSGPGARQGAHLLSGAAGGGPGGEAQHGGEGGGRA